MYFKSPSISFNLLISIITITLHCIRKKNRFTARCLYQASINITARCSSIVAFTAIRQIFAVPQTKLLPSSHGWRIGESRQHQLWRKWVVTRNQRPLGCLVSYELARRQKNATARGCYYSVYMVFHAWVLVASPIRPMVSFECITRHITIHVDQFDWCQFAAGRNKELAKPVVSGSKTHQICIQLYPPVCKEAKINCFE